MDYSWSNYKKRKIVAAIIDAKNEGKTAEEIYDMFIEATSKMDCHEIKSAYNRMVSDMINEEFCD